MRTIQSHLKYSPNTLLHVIPAVYSNHRLALQVEDARTGEPMAVATVNLPDEKLAPNEIAVKDYSENEGMVDTLVKGDIIEPIASRYILSGYVTIGIYMLTQSAERWLHQEQSA
jgi:hypothetical protein